jgi:hypothetical protein
VSIPAPEPQDLDLRYLVRCVLLQLRKSHPEALADEEVRRPLLLARTAADRLARVGRLRGDARRGHQPEFKDDNPCSHG